MLPSTVIKPVPGRADPPPLPPSTPLPQREPHVVAVAVHRHQLHQLAGQMDCDVIERTEPE